MSSPLGEPLLAFDGAGATGRRLARLWWHAVSRDRYELRPYSQVPWVPAHGPVTWVAADGTVRHGREALAAALAAAAPRWRHPLRALRSWLAPG